MIKKNAKPINQYKKAEQAYIKYIKSLKQKVNNKSSQYFELPIWESWTHGTNINFAMIEIDGIEFLVDPCQSYKIYQLNSDFLKIANSLAIKMNANIITSYESELIGWSSLKHNYAKGIEFRSKPCNEYNKLKSWLIRKGINLKSDWDMYSIELFGKRGQYDESGSKKYLAHKANVCNRILDELKQSYHYGDKLTLSELKEIDDIDTGYSIEYETECYGTRIKYYDISIFAKSGKIRKIIPLY